MENLMPPQAGQAVPQAPQDEPQVDEATNNATLAALDIMYEPDVIAGVTDTLSSGNAGISAGELAAQLVIQADENNNNEIPEDAVIPAAAQVLDEIIDFMGEKGIAELSESQAKEAANAMMHTLMKAYGVEAEDIEALAAESEGDQEVVTSIQDSVAQRGGNQ